jgi:hypothetical protein
LLEDTPIQGCKVGSTCGSISSTNEIIDEVVQPVSIWIRISVDKGNNFAGGCARAGIASHAQALALESQDFTAVSVGEGTDYLGCRIFRTIVDHDDLKNWVREFRDALKTLLDGFLSVANTHDDRNSWGGTRTRKRYLGKRSLDAPKPWSWGALPRSKTKSPVFDRTATPVPLVCPREHDSPNTTTGEHGLNLLLQSLRLLSFAVSEAVHPEFSDKQGQVASHVLESGNVIEELPPRLQVNIEATNV